MTLKYVYESIYEAAAPKDNECDHDNFKIHGHCVGARLFYFAEAVLSLREYKDVSFYSPYETNESSCPRTDTLYGVFPGNLIMDFYIGVRMEKYAFTTEKIIKPRIRNDSYKKRTKESVNMKTILNHMVKNVPAPDSSDVLNRLSREYKAAASSRSSTMTSKTKAAKQKLSNMLNVHGDNRDLLNELLHLYKSGYQFQHQSVQTAMDELVSIMAEQEEQDDVSVYDTVALLPKIPGINRTLVRYYQDVREAVNRTVSDRVLAIEELPEEALRGVMILQAVENGTLIEGVGYKQNNNLYFVHSRSLKDGG